MKTLIHKIKQKPNLYVGIIPINLFGILGLWYATMISFNFSSIILILFGFILLKIIGIGAGYHRLFSHNSYKTNRFYKILMLVLGTASGQGSCINWAAIHKGLHHRYTDTENDPHSPNKGFWHSYFLWMFKIKYNSVSLKSLTELLRDKDIMFFHKHYIILFCCIHLLIAMISTDLWVYLLAIPAFLTFHSYCVQTSLSHMKRFGYRNFDTKDESVNIALLFFITLDEAWHNNHHNNPKNPNYGEKWWEIDPTYWFVKLIKKD